MSLNSTKAVEAQDPVPTKLFELSDAASLPSDVKAETAGPTKRFTVGTVQFDARFPNTNQTRHCFQAYVDYFRCIKAQGDDSEMCKQFKTAYQSICPIDWVEKADERREAGIFPGRAI